MRFESMWVGVDEVGRGCLAGPVVACAFSFNLPGELGQDPSIHDQRVQSALAEWEKVHKVILTDSKAISAKKREKLAELLPTIGSFSIAEVSVDEIDQINILQASLRAMKLAVESLSLKLPWSPERPPTLLVDGNQEISKLNLNWTQQTVIGGDSKVLEISAASILAKVYRDQLMDRLADQFPEYGWSKNKGYGSKEHLAALVCHGVTPWHRKTFGGVKELVIGSTKVSAAKSSFGFGLKKKDFELS